MEQSRRKTLSQLDTNHMSAIPQPSARKASGHRSSQIAAAPAYNNNNNNTNLHHHRQSSYGEGRLSYAGGLSSSQGHATAGATGSGSAQGQRRSSVFGPPGASGHGHRNSSIGGLGVLSGNGSQAPNKDPRPVRDKLFKETSARKLTDYLHAAGYPQPIGPKTFTQPTQKEFNSIFMFLYHQYDPEFKFVKKIEEDVMTCIKAIRYPFADNITRSQLAAVGAPHSWANMLAMLVWMVDSLTVVDRLINQEIEVHEDGGDNPNKVYFEHYLKDAYQVFLGGSDDCSEMKQALETESNRQNEQVLADIDRLTEENERLEQEMRAMQLAQPSLKALQTEQGILISDKTKFQNHIARLKQKGEQVAVVNDRVKEQLKEAELNMQQLHAKKQEYQEVVDKQDISATDLEKMTSEQEALKKNLELASTQVHEISSAVLDKEKLAQEKLERLDKAVQTYNTLGYQIAVIPETAENANGIVFEIDMSTVDVDRSWVAARPDTLVKNDLRKVIKPALQELHQTLGLRVHAALDEVTRLSDLLDEINEAIADTREVIDTLEAKVSMTIEQHDEIRDTATAEQTSSNAQAEALERDLATMRITAQNGLIQLDNQQQTVTHEYDQLVHKASTFREELTRDVVRTLDQVIHFKLHIQRNLGELDADVGEDQAEERSVAGAV